MYITISYKIEECLFCKQNYEDPFSWFILKQRLYGYIPYNLAKLGGSYPFGHIYGQYYLAP